MQGDLDSAVRGLSEGAAKKLREKLEPHVGQPKSYELPEDSGGVTGFYIAEEAEGWIADYYRFAVFCVCFISKCKSFGDLRQR